MAESQLLKKTLKVTFSHFSLNWKVLILTPCQSGVAYGSLVESLKEFSCPQKLVRSLGLRSESGFQSMSKSLRPFC